MGDLRFSEMLVEIRGTGVFNNLVQIISDNSCALSNENPAILDEGDKMRIADYEELMNFYLKNKTLKVGDEDSITEIFYDFVNRDMIL